MVIVLVLKIVVVRSGTDSTGDSSRGMVVVAVVAVLVVMALV